MKGMKKMKKENPVAAIFGFAGEEKKKLMLSAIISVLSVFSGLIPYVVAAKLLDTLIAGNLENENIIKFGLLGLGAFIMQEVLNSISTYISHGVAFNTLSNIRVALIDKISKTSMGYIKGQPLGNFKKTIMDDVESLEYVLAHAVPEVTSNIIAPIVLIVYLFTINWSIALASLASAIIGFIITGIMMAGGAMKIFKMFTEGSAKMNSNVIEYVNGMEVIKVFNQTASSMKRYEGSVINYRDVMGNWFKHCWPFLAANNVITPLSIAFVLPAASFSYMNGNMSITNMILSMVISLGIAGPLIKLVKFTDHLNEIIMVNGKLKEIFNAPEIAEGNKAANIKDNGIKAENIVFGYSDTEIIHNISFEAAPGTMTALVGASGSGKSTIAKLIARFYEVNSGTIKIGGMNIKDMLFDKYTDLISYVSQDNYLPNMSLKDNILMGKPDATEKEVMFAAKAAGCDEFISKFEKGYDTLVGDAGDRLSGGERARITIARAIIKNAPIVILDEATASIDPENESKIQNALDKLSKGKTLIVIAHRLSTIVNADNIIVMDKGNIAAQGTHKKLLEESEIYKDMWEAHIGAKQWSMNKELDVSKKIIDKKIAEVR